jgi:hypothetical protein
VPATSSISIIIARRETAHQQPYVYQVCPHALSTQQPYCTVLMMRIIIIDTTEQASTRSIISALSPCTLATSMQDVCCTRRHYLRPRTHPPFHQHASPIFPQPAVACLQPTCTRNPIHTDYATPTTMYGYMYPPIMQRRTSTQAQMTKPAALSRLQVLPKESQAFSFASSCGAGYAEK